VTAVAKNISDSGFEFHRGLSRYPWNQWLDGNIWELTHGLDFVVDVKTLRVLCYFAAKRRRKKVRTKILVGNEIKFIIQAYS
jgi:hypothetical protein